MPQGILTPKDYFSDRTLGDTYVQAMQIKGARSQMADAEARRAQEPQNQRMRDMQEVDTAWKLISDITKEQGVEGGNALARELYNESPAFQNFHPGGAPEVVAHDSQKGYHVSKVKLSQPRKDAQGRMVPAGELVYMIVDDAGNYKGIVGEVPEDEKPEKPARTREKAVEKKVLLTGKLHTLDSNPMSYAGDPEAYRKSLVQALEHNNQFLPEGNKWKPKQVETPPQKPFPLHSQLIEQTETPNGAPGAGAAASAEGVRYGVDNATGRRVMMLPDGTIEYAP